jgi:thioredoxin 1
MGEQTFESEVLQSASPVLVHFGAPWCGPCRMIDPVLSRFQAEYAGAVKLVKVNADESLRLTSQYRITTLPTLLFFSGGTLLHRVEGLYKREILWTELLQLVTGLVKVNS